MTRRSPDGTQRSARHSGAPVTAHAACLRWLHRRGHPSTRGVEPRAVTVPKTPTPLLPPPGDATGPACAPWGCTASPTGPAHSPRGTRQQPSSTPRLQPSPSTPPPSLLYASGFGPNLVRQEPIWSPDASRASFLGLGSTQGGGQPLLEAAGIEAAKGGSASTRDQRHTPVFPLKMGRPSVRASPCASVRFGPWNGND